MSSRVSNIRIERVKKGLTQAQLAEVIGVAPITITRWEENFNPMPAEKLKQLAEYFGCSTDYLVEEVEV